MAAVIAGIPQSSYGCAGMNRRGVILISMFLSANLRAAPPTLDLKLVANQLTNVTAITHAGDGSGRLFVTLQAGQIKIFNGSQVLATNFLNLGTLTTGGGERGLLSAAFSPGYATNGLFWVYYTRSSDGALAIARYSVSTNANVADPNGTVILTIPHPAGNHNGGQLQFGPDGYLYAGPGDGGSSCDLSGSTNNAQNLSLLLGKLLRLDVSNVSTTYTIPPSNPFVSSNGVRPEIWAYGLRNPWRFSFDRTTGDLLIGDVGQNAWEEVDFQTAGSPGGQNYGWRLTEGFVCGTCTNGCTNNITVTQPILVYNHSGKCSISGGYRYRGGAIPPLAGTYVYADYCSGEIFGATQSLAGTWSSATLTDTVFNITTFGEDQFGELYVNRYSNDVAGAVYRLIWKDTDGDGMPDDSEILAGTDPNNPNSFLRITATGPSNADWTVTFGTVSNKLYRLERTDDLVVTNWVTVTNNIAGTGNPLQVADPAAAARTQRFYRVRLLP